MKHFKLIKLVILLSLMSFSQSVRPDTLSLSLQDVDIRVAMLMLSKHEKMNIFVAEGVDGKVTVNIYNMETMDAIHAIAESTGFAVEIRGNSIFIINREDAGKYRDSNLTEVRTFKIQYTTPSEIEPILKDQLSSYGSIKSLPSNKIIIVEDTPIFLDKIEKLLVTLDREPKQILIEAKILEIILSDNQSFGFNWSKLFSSSTASGSVGTQGLATATASGFFGQYTNKNIDLVLNALKERTRLRTLSTPKLLAMEGREAETVVGTRLGFKVTTTVNQVTSESIEFLETGIILKVTPSVDRSGRILLDIHPEVSAGTVSDERVPSKTTTQISTRMLVPNGKTVFMGGLIRRTSNNSRESVPGLGDLPVVGALFSNDSKNITTSEIVVLLTPTIVNFDTTNIHSEATINVEKLDELLQQEQKQIEAKMRKVMDDEDDYDPLNSGY
ncbi:MAG: type II secretion system protein GspD [Thiotrichaceae bacterium]|nr:type II secretion system protein GspD [Thiotrichaceae bacterium]